MLIPIIKGAKGIKKNRPIANNIFKTRETITIVLP